MIIINNFEIKLLEFMVNSLKNIDNKYQNFLKRLLKAILTENDN